MAPHRTTLLLLPLLLIAGVRCQLDTTREAVAEGAAESSGDLQTDVPSLSAIFSTLLPNLNRNPPKNLTEDVSPPSANSDPNSTDTSVSGQSGTHSEMMSQNRTVDSGTFVTESTAVDNVSRQEETVEVNLITPVSTGDVIANVTAPPNQKNPSSITEDIAISTTSGKSPAPPSQFSPSPRFTLSEEEFQPRSGLVEDIYDYANDFGERISNQGSSGQSNDRNTPTLPTLYPRDQPEDLVPFEDIRSGSQTVLPSGRPSAQWQPNWPSDLVPTPVPINVRDTSSPGIVEDVPSVFHFPEPTSVDMSIHKEPITQYFFDLSDAASSSSNVPGPLFDPSTTTVAPHDTLNTSSNINSVGVRPQTVDLQPSLSASEESVSSSSVTPGVTPGLTLTTGIDINKIYSSAFFPSALPSAIHTSNTDSSAIESVHNDIATELQAHPTETDEVSELRLSNNSNSEPASDTIDSTGIRAAPDYILGSDADYFPTSSGGVDQDLEFTGTSNRHPEHEDELALGSAASAIVEESTLPEEEVEDGITEPAVALFVTTPEPAATTVSASSTTTETIIKEEDSTPIIYAVEEFEDTTTSSTTTSTTTPPPTTTTTSTTEEPTTTTTTTTTESTTTTTTPEPTTTTETSTSPTTSSSTMHPTFSEEEISKPVTVEPPELTTITILSNGTREFSDVPFMRALLAVDSTTFCNNKHQYASLLAVWLGAELNDSTIIEPTDIHFFGKPYCDEMLDSNFPEFRTSDPLLKSSNEMHSLYPSEHEPRTSNPEDLPRPAKLQSTTTTTDQSGGGTSDATYSASEGVGPASFTPDSHAVDEEDFGNEKTNVYFYVGKDGEMDVNRTEAFPLFPKEINLSEEQQQLANTFLQLELVRPKSASIMAGVPPGGDPSSPPAGLGTAGIVAIVVAAALLLVTVIAVVIFVMYRRKKAVDNYYGKRCTPVSMDAYSVDSVSVYHSFRRKSKRNRSNRSVKSYLNQGFEDPNGPSRPLDFAQLTHFISDMDGVHQEFATIPVSSPNYDDLPPNVQEKNRYANVIPVPETRVLLKGFKDVPEKQYINANYVKGPQNEAKYFIATQAPLESTVGDFWRMVWEQETRVIVMLTDFVERGIDKCADYLPPSQTLDCHRVYGDFQVTLKSRDMQEKFVVSGVLLKNLENNLTRDISHMWFTGWPVMGVPHTEKPFISFVLGVRRARKQLRAKGPVVVHCSPGTGRTGTFLAVEHCMRQFEQDRAIDVAKTVYTLRRERAGAVQTSDQYCFIYRVINLYASKLSSGNLDSL